MSATSILKAYSRIAILRGTLLILSGLAQGMDAESLSQVNQTGTDSKGKTQATNDGIPLEKGKPIEREIAAGQTEQYRLTLTEGEYVRVVIEQKGTDVVVVLLGPDGKKLDEAGSQNVRQGTETLSFIAAVSGGYKVEVHLLKEAPAGRYEIGIAELRTATRQDQNRIMAEKTYKQGQSLQTEATAQSLPKAIEKYQEALGIFRGIGDHREEATTLNDIGVIYDSLGEKQKALEFFNQALPLRRDVGDRKGEAETLSDIGAVYSSLGETRKALDYHNQALPLRRAVGDRPGEANTLTNIGLVYRLLGEMQKALDYYNQSLPISRAVGDRQGEATTLNNIGRVYDLLGEKQKALDYYNQSLLLKRAVGDRPGEAVTLNNIGLVYRSLGETQKGLDHYNQSLSISRAVGDRRGEAITLNNIGYVYKLLGELQKALDYYNQALSITKAVGDREGEARVFNNIGAVYNSLGEKQKALDYFNQALVLWRILNLQQGEANTLYGIARIASMSGNLSEARSQIEAVLKIVEALRTKVASPELRASYFTSAQPYYEFYIDLLMQSHGLDPSQGYDAVALEASERARARSLLEMLIEARADIRHEADSALLERERSLLGQLNTAIEKRTGLLGRKHSPEEAAAAGKRIDALASEYEQVQSQIRLKSPHYAALTQPSLLSLKEIQQLLDPDTVLLEYSLGRERSFLWLVTTTSMASFVLPKRKEIEAAAKDLLTLLTESGTPEEFEAKAAQVGQILLGPVASRLEKKRLAIVADGLLQYLPLAALNAPIAGAKKYQPLIVDHEIVNLPSASALAIMRSQLGSRKPAPKSIAILADPVFSRNDQRIISDTNLAVVPPAEQSFDKVTRSARKLGLLGDGDNWKRLPLSRQEAEQISAFASKSEAKLALDFDANLSTATAPEIGGYRILHFATHALFNDETPELSGLVLSLVNEKGEPRNGFLSLPEIFNLNLAADLVVLSACQTGLGKDVRGEGLVGLTRGFMYAGAPRIVASLWIVRDKDALELMVRFYTAILREKLPPAAALRKAQVSMWREGRWSANRWAGFVFQGEWR